MNMDNDFGFTFEEEPKDKTHELISTQDKYQRKLEDIESLMVPLLDSLLKNPDKPMIKWKNRIEVVGKIKDHLLKLTRD